MRRGLFPGGWLGWLVLAGLLLAGGGLARVLVAWYGPGPLAQPLEFTVPPHARLATLAGQLAEQGAIGSPVLFREGAQWLGDHGPVKAGEFLIPAHASAARILRILEGAEGVLHRRVTIPEGLPSVLVAERLRAIAVLTGPVEVPAEGSVLPDTYEYHKGETRAAVLARMQAAMSAMLAAAWHDRAPDLVVKTPAEAVTLAAIVEKETAKPSERPVVAGLYANRLRRGMPLQADPTIIYPITGGKPLGRRILASEIHQHNAYNTYAMAGLPRGPITNPGRAALTAVLHPADTQALYMVADGTGGHAFAATLSEHNANVQHWRKLRAENDGE